MLTQWDVFAGEEFLCFSFSFLCNCYCIFICISVWLFIAVQKLLNFFIYSLCSGFSPAWSCCYSWVSCRWNIFLSVIATCPWHTSSPSSTKCVVLKGHSFWWLWFKWSAIKTLRSCLLLLSPASTAQSSCCTSWRSLSSGNRRKRWLICTCCHRWKSKCFSLSLSASHSRF